MPSCDKKVSINSHFKVWQFLVAIPCANLDKNKMDKIWSSAQYNTATKSLNEVLASFQTCLFILNCNNFRLDWVKSFYLSSLSTNSISLPSLYLSILFLPLSSLSPYYLPPHLSSAISPSVLSFLFISHFLSLSHSLELESSIKKNSSVSR